MTRPASEPSAGERRELELLDAWRHGDASAMATLLRGYQSRVYAICVRMLRSPEEAGDLTQDALLKILEGLHTFDRRAQLSTWVIRVTMNCCLSHLRKQKLRRHASLDDFGQRSGSWASLGASLPAATEVEPAGAESVERSEQRAAVLRGLARLESEARAILVLRDTQGLEYQQIGEVFGVPVGTVKSRLFRARAALRELTEEELGHAGGDRPERQVPRGSPAPKPQQPSGAAAGTASNRPSVAGSSAAGSSVAGDQPHVQPHHRRPPGPRADQSLAPSSLPRRTPNPGLPNP